MYEGKNANYQQATFYLGEVMHYFGDISTPYHPANITSVDSLGHIKNLKLLLRRERKYNKINTDGSKTNEQEYNDILINKDFNYG